MGLANGLVGYVPTEEALSPQGGGYETRLTSYSNLIPSAGRTMAAKGIELANGFAPDAVARPELAPLYEDGGAWSYGIVAPQVE